MDSSANRFRFHLHVRIFGGIWHIMRCGPELFLQTSRIVVKNAHKISIFDYPECLLHLLDGLALGSFRSDISLHLFDCYGSLLLPQYIEGITTGHSTRFWNCWIHLLGFCAGLSRSLSASSWGQVDGHTYGYFGSNISAFYKSHFSFHFAHALQTAGQRVRDELEIVVHFVVWGHDSRGYCFCYVSADRFGW